jgi:hypothetical protein
MVNTSWKPLKEREKKPNKSSGKLKFTILKKFECIYHIKTNSDNRRKSCIWEYFNLLAGIKLQISQPDVYNHVQVNYQILKSKYKNLY